MRLHRFIGDFDFSRRRLTVSDKSFVNQLKKVLRLNSGDEVIVADGKLREARARVVGFEKDFVEFDIVEVVGNNNEPRVSAVLYCALLKRENFELVAQKATEVGIAELVPVAAERTVKLGLKRDRLEKIIREAAEQSGRGIVPRLSLTLSFKDALEDARDNDVNFFFEGNGPRGFPSCASEVARSRTVGVFIGPEGGWSDDEVGLAKEKKIGIVSLGPLTLRAETAAIVASYLVVSSVRQ